MIRVVVAGAVPTVKPKKQSSLLGPVGLALTVFAAGCGILLYGLATSRGGLMFAGGLIMGASGGLAALLGEKISQDFVKYQGGGPARRAREEAERRADTTPSELTVPEDWDERPKDT